VSNQIADLRQDLNGLKRDCREVHRKLEERLDDHQRDVLDQLDELRLGFLVYLHHEPAIVQIYAADEELKGELKIKLEEARCRIVDSRLDMITGICTKADELMHGSKLEAPGTEAE